MSVQSHFCIDACPIQFKPAPSHGMLFILMQKSHWSLFYLQNAFLCPLLIPLQKKKNPEKYAQKFLQQIAWYPLTRRAECSFLLLHTAHESGPSPAVSPASPERIWRQLQQRAGGKTPPTAPEQPRPLSAKTPPRHPKPLSDRRAHILLRAM